MRICQVLETGGGGAARHVLDLSRELAERGHDVTLVYSPVRAVPRFLDELAALPVRPVRVDMRRNPSLNDIVAARKLAAATLEHGPFDILHGHSAKAGILARFIPSRGAARVYTPHAFRALDPEAHPLVRHATLAAERLMGAIRTDALIAVSKGEMDFASTHRIANGRRCLIRNGVVSPRSIDRKAVRARLGFAAKDFVMGFVGRLSWQKDPQRFVSAAAEVMRTRPDARAVLIGDGELRAEVAAAICATGMAKRFVQLPAADAQDFIGIM